MDRTQKLVIEIDPQRATVVLKQEILGVISRKEICPEDLFQAIIHATNRNSFISSGLLPKGCFSVEIGESGADVIDHVQAGGVLVDGLGVGDVGNIVLRDRQNLAQNGIIIVVLTLEKHSNLLLSGPDIVSRGFVYVRESEDLMEEAQAIVDQAVADCLERHVSDWGKIKNIIKDSLSDFLWKRMKRNPMILPIIMEV